MKKVLLGDAIELIKSIGDNSVDCIFTDPPYGLTASKWDKIVDFEILWFEFERVLKKGAPAILFASQPFTTKLINSNYKNFKYCWYWKKNQTTNFFHAKRMPLRAIEEICIFYGKNYFPQITEGHVATNSAKGCSNGQVYHGTNTRNYEGGKTTRYPNNFLEFKCVDNYSRIHPNEKPVDLCEYIIKTYTKKGDLLLDCFAGGGSLLYAAKNLDRNFIGIEKESLYYEKILNRLENASANPF